MRQVDSENNKIKKVNCDYCKKEFRISNGIITEGSFNVDYMWGYFSKKDGQRHSFDLCEKCYEELILNKIDVTIEDATELI